MNPVYFWIILALSSVSWFIYPLFLCFSALFRRNTPWIEPVEWPSVSILVAARNEENVIARRIENLLAQVYPGRLEILIGSDSSDDATDEIVQTFANDDVILFRSPDRIGKPLIIQELLKLSGNDIIVFTDADTEFAVDAVKELVLPYGNPGVGCVDGSRMNSLDGTTCESAYWKYEKTIKKLCSRLGAVLGATGAIFSLRRNLFMPVAPNRADDFELAVMTRVQGYSCVFNERAIAVEQSPSDSSQYHRMVRIVSWMLTSCVLLMGKALKKGKILLFLQLLVHKMLRWFSGILILCATVLSGFLAGTPVYTAVFLLMCSFHLLAAAGLFLKSRLPSKLLFPYYFWLMNIASIDGIFRTLAGNPVEMWEKRTLEEDY
jgi:cellulose synthase/poly-beta-1,6-N-acetylglucosamine synthase-like glycosyltransferase